MPPICWPCSRPRNCSASSSAVDGASVLIRQCSVSFSPSKTPRTVLVLPTSMVSSMTSSLPQVHRDVERRRGVGERADGQVVDAGGGHLGGSVEGEVAA